jgi:tRNA pseudouridine32 synthase/23S rRNA pseudouridine746 synthase
MYTIVAEQDDFLIVNKHQGACVHSEPEEKGVLVALKEDLALDQVYPVHRLDKVTSGLLLVAKNQAAASELSQLFQHRKIEKYYVAISDHKPAKKQGAVIGDMERSRRSSWKLCRSQKNPAVTRFFSYGLGGGKRLFLLKPITGKTHQLRVALKSIGSPIMGDRLYGHPDTIDAGIFLHAFFLRFHYQDQEYTYRHIPDHWFDLAKPDASVQLALNAALQEPASLAWPS